MAKSKKKKEVKEPGKRGPKTKYKPEYVDLVYKLCLLKCTDAEIANILNITETTFNNWKNEYPKLFESIKKGKEEADANVSKSLLQRAMGYEHEDVDIRVVDHQIVQTKVIKKYPPDSTAMIFWLKNRHPEKWREKHELEHSGKDGGPLVIEVVKFATEDKSSK